MDIVFATFWSPIISAIIGFIGIIINLAVTINRTKEKVEKPSSQRQHIDDEYIDDLNKYIDELCTENEVMVKKLKTSHIISVILIILFVFIIISVIFFYTRNADSSDTNDIPSVTSTENPYASPVIKLNSNVALESATLKNNIITIKIKKDELFSEDRTKRGIILYSPQDKAPYNNENVFVIEVGLNEESYTLNTKTAIKTVDTGGYRTYKVLDNYSSGAIRNNICEIAFDITNDYTDISDVYIYGILNINS